MGFISLAAALVFIPLIGNCPLFDWDEINFAECAREMLVSGNYSEVQLNYYPFWEKPPFFIWLQAISMKIFGVNEFAARFPNALCSIVSFLSMYHIGKRFHSPRFGFVWCFVYAASLLPHLYFKSGIIDPWFNLFIILSLYNVIVFYNNENGKKEMLNALYAGVFLGLAVLTKGPAALVVMAISVLFVSIWSGKVHMLKNRSFLIFCFVTLLVSASWFIVQILQGNAQIVKEFIVYQLRLFETGDSGHDGPFYYHVVVLLAGCFPASFLFIAAYRYTSSLTPFQLLFRRFFITLFWVVLILFSIVKTKIVHYSSLCYFPLTFIATLGVCQFYEQLRLGRIARTLYIIIAAAFSVGFLLVGFADEIIQTALQNNWIKDEFTRENLKAEVGWNVWESVTGLIVLVSSWLIYWGISRCKTSFLYSGLLGNMLFIYLSIVVIIPKVELYTQHACIAFYKAISTQSCYVETHAFKSYAYLFYSNRKPSDYSNPDQLKFLKEEMEKRERSGQARFTSIATANSLWMKYGNIDRPAYMVARGKDDTEEVAATPGFTRLYSRNGFTFFVRMPERAGTRTAK